MSSANELTVELDSGSHDPTQTQGDVVASKDGAEGMNGNRLGRFWVRDTLGHGGMGVVLDAYDEVLDRTVALKLLHRTRRERDQQRLLQEAKALARLSHPNVVQIYDVGEVNGNTFIAMEVVRGQTLRQWVGREPRTWRDIVKAYIQAGEGLAAAHSVGLVHRDFKPENCIIGENGRVRVLDFGLARPTTTSEHDTRDSDQDQGVEEPDSNPRLTRPGLVIGTVAYMAYEQLHGTPASPRSDQYSFCASLYEALYGVLPYPGQSSLEIAMAIEGGELSSPASDIRVPRQLRRLLLRGLSRDPNTRWASMRAVIRQLRAIVRPRRWGRTITPLVVGVGIGGAAWAVIADDVEACDKADAAITEAWNGERRDTVAQLFTHHIPDEPVGQRVLARLDGYATAWSEMSHEACYAAFVSHEQSPRVFDRRMRCLDEHRDRLDSTVTTLLESRSRDELIQRSSLPFRLASLEPCEAAHELDDADAPSGGIEGETAPRIRQMIVRAHTLRDAGAIAEGLELATHAREDAMALGDRRLLAEALECLGRLQAESTSYRQATDTLSDAIVIASEAHADEIAAKAWLSLLYAMTIDLDLDRAESRILAARAAVERTDDDTLRAWWLNNVGILYGELNRHEEASASFEDALALKSNVLGRDHLDVGIAWLNLGTHRVDIGDQDGASEAFDEAYAIVDATVGPLHPLATVVESGRCRVAEARQDYEIAVHRCTRVIETLDRLPSSALFEVRMRLILARALWGAGKKDQARNVARIGLDRGARLDDPAIGKLRGWLEDHS